MTKSRFVKTGVYEIFFCFCFIIVNNGNNNTNCRNMLNVFYVGPQVRRNQWVIEPSSVDEQVFNPTGADLKHEKTFISIMSCEPYKL